MKPIFKIAALIVFIAISDTSFALGNLKVNIFPFSDEKAVVAISALSDSIFRIMVVD
jgi:hypothetical protein